MIESRRGFALGGRLRGTLAAVAVFLVLLVPQVWCAEEIWLGLYRLSNALGLYSKASRVTIGGVTLGTPPMWYNTLAGVAFYLGALFIPVWLALWAYHRVAIRPPAPDGHTYCGRCGYILKGLSEPRCPECGRPI